MEKLKIESEVLNILIKEYLATENDATLDILLLKAQELIQLIKSD
jgi:hypothetical protein